MTPHVEHTNSRSSAMNAKWIEMVGGVYRIPLFADDDMNPEAKGYLGTTAGKARITFQADYSNYKTGNVEIQTPSGYDFNNVIRSLGKKASPVDVYTNYDKDGNLIVTDDGRQLGNLPQTIQGRTVTVEVPGVDRTVTVRSEEDPTTFTKVRKLKQGLDFAVMPMYMAQCVKE